MNGNEPAFPHKTGPRDYVPGMDVRTWLAGMIIANLSATRDREGDWVNDAKEIADRAVTFSDVLIERLSR